MSEREIMSLRGTSRLDRGAYVNAGGASRFRVQHLSKFNYRGNAIGALR